MIIFGNSVVNSATATCITANTYHLVTYSDSYFWQNFPTTFLYCILSVHYACHCTVACMFL